MKVLRMNLVENFLTNSNLGLAGARKPLYKQTYNSKLLKAQK